MSSSSIHYLPIVTTVLSAVFATVLWRRWRERRALHLLWWTIGIVAYGTGTLLESAITLLGNSVLLTKLWYVAGALFGGYPLAQGSVYLHLSRRTAHRLTAITLPLLLAAAALVLVSPVVPGALEAHRPSGAVLGWSWIRLLTPFVNLYAVIFLLVNSGRQDVDFVFFTVRTRQIWLILLSMGLGAVLASILPRWWRSRNK